MSAAMNLSPRNPFVLALLIGGGLYMLTRRPAAAGVRSTGPATQQQGVSSIPILGPALQAIAGAFSGSIGAPGAVRDDARAAVRWGDPYYSGDWGIGGMSPEVWAAQVASDAAAWNASIGSADDSTGDPYNPW